MKKLLKFSIWIIAGLLTGLFINYILSRPFTPPPIAEPIEAKEISEIQLSEVQQTEKTIIEIGLKMGCDPEVLLRLADCESKIKNIRGKINKDDRGIFQINSKHHPEVSDECAYSPACATYFTCQMIKEGRGSEWRCWDKIKL